MFSLASKLLIFTCVFFLFVVISLLYISFSPENLKLTSENVFRSESRFYRLHLEKKT